MKNLPYAEDIGHFWKTSKTPADSWMDKTIALIKQHGGKPLQSFTGAASTAVATAVDEW